MQLPEIVLVKLTNLLLVLSTVLTALAEPLPGDYGTVFCPWYEDNWCQFNSSVVGAIA